MNPRAVSVAYRQTTKIVHPDMCKHPQSAEAFNKLVESHEVRACLVARKTDAGIADAERWPLAGGGEAASSRRAPLSFAREARVRDVPDGSHRGARAARAQRMRNQTMPSRVCVGERSSRNHRRARASARGVVWCGSEQIDGPHARPRSASARAPCSRSSARPRPTRSSCARPQPTSPSCGAGRRPGGGRLRHERAERDSIRICFLAFDLAACRGRTVCTMHADRGRAL